jgi:hypothetical protein
MTSYVPSSEQWEKVKNNFIYHKPITDQAERYEYLRKLGLDLGEAILACCPNSREASLAMTNLEQAIMWANASIARNERDETQIIGEK